MTKPIDYRKLAKASECLKRASDAAFSSTQFPHGWTNADPANTAEALASIKAAQDLIKEATR